MKHPRLTAIAVGAGLGLVAVTAALAATFAGVANVLIGDLTVLVALGAAVLGLVLLVVTDRGPRQLAVAAALLTLPLSIPAARIASAKLVDDAIAHCMDLARGTPGDPPLLARPGYSPRYEFSFSSRDGAFTCKFPDPGGGRTYWYGEATATTPWSFDHLMD